MYVRLTVGDDTVIFFSLVLCITYPMFLHECSFSTGAKLIRVTTILRPGTASILQGQGLVLVVDG